MAIRCGEKGEPYYYQVANESWKYGVCDKDGKEIISPYYDSPCNRLGGEDEEAYWYSIEKNGKRGACDNTGKIVIQPRYESVIYSNDNFVVRTNGDYLSTGITLRNGTNKQFTPSKGNVSLVQSFGKLAAGAKERTKIAQERKTSTIRKKYHDYAAFHVDEDVKEVKKKFEYNTGHILDGLLTEEYIFKFDRDGRLINAKECGISNMIHNKDGYLIGYERECLKYTLEYEYLTMESGEVKGRLIKEIVKGSEINDEINEYNYCYEKSDYFSYIYDKRYWYRNGNLDRVLKTEKRYDGNAKNTYYYYLYPASEKFNYFNWQIEITIEEEYWR